MDQWTSGPVDQLNQRPGGPVDHPRDASESQLEVDLALHALGFLGLLPSVALHYQHVHCLAKSLSPSAWALGGHRKLKVNSLHFLQSASARHLGLLRFRRL